MSLENAFKYKWMNFISSALDNISPNADGEYVLSFTTDTTEEEKAPIIEKAKKLNIQFTVTQFSFQESQ